MGIRDLNKVIFYDLKNLQTYFLILFLKKVLKHIKSTKCAKHIDY